MPTSGDTLSCDSADFSVFHSNSAGDLDEKFADIRRRHVFGNPKLWRAAHGCTTHAHGGWAPSAQVLPAASGTANVNTEKCNIYYDYWVTLACTNPLRG